MSQKERLCQLEWTLSLQPWAAYAQVLREGVEQRALPTMGGFVVAIVHGNPLVRGKRSGRKPGAVETHGGPKRTTFRTMVFGPDLPLP